MLTLFLTQLQIMQKIWDTSHPLFTPEQYVNVEGWAVCAAVILALWFYKNGEKTAADPVSPAAPQSGFGQLQLSGSFEADSFFLQRCDGAWWNYLCSDPLCMFVLTLCSGRRPRLFMWDCSLINFFYFCIKLLALWSVSAENLHLTGTFSNLLLHSLIDKQKLNNRTDEPDELYRPLNFCCIKLWQNI